jgi:hypothetical protein
MIKHDLISAAAEASELLSEDELEQVARESKKGCASRQAPTLTICGSWSSLNSALPPQSKPEFRRIVSSTFCQ